MKAAAHPLTTIRLVVQLGPRGAFRLLSVWTLLGITRLLTLSVPFRVIRRLLSSKPTTSTNDHEPASITEKQHRLATRIGAFTQLAARHTPWQSLCYPQALTARTQLVLARIPHTVFFGVRRSEGGALEAHCWVTVADVAVVGGDGHNFTAVGSFEWSP